MKRQNAPKTSPSPGCKNEYDQSTERPYQKKISERVTELAEPILEAEGLELVLVEYRREARGQVLRLFVDRPGGVTIDDCVFVNRQVGDLVDVYLENESKFHLEVSSPGANRPLVKEEHFQRFAGKKAVIRTKRPIDGRKNYTGVLSGASNGVVTIIVDNEPIALSVSEIASARLHHQNGEGTC